MRYLSSSIRVRLLLLIVGVLTLAAVPALSQEFSIDNKPEQYSLFRDIGNDFVYMFQQPDFFYIIGGVTAAPYVFRGQFENESPELTEMWGQSAGADNFFESGEILGNAAVPLAASALLLAYHKSGEQSPFKRFTSDMIRAQLFNGMITISMKYLVKRTRPNGGPFSYPSGHTSTAFTAAGVIYGNYGLKYGIPAFLLASYVGLSRLQENKHYLSDITAGAIIGTYISLKIVHRKQKQGAANFTPAMIHGSPGAAVSLRF